MDGAARHTQGTRLRGQSLPQDGFIAIVTQSTSTRVGIAAPPREAFSRKSISLQAQSLRTLRISMGSIDAKSEAVDEPPIDFAPARHSRNVWVEAFCDLVRDWRPIGWAEEQGKIRGAIGPHLDRRIRERATFITHAPPCPRRQIRARQSIRGRTALDGLYVPAANLRKLTLASPTSALAPLAK